MWGIDTSPYTSGSFATRGNVFHQQANVELPDFYSLLVIAHNSGAEITAKFEAEHPEGRQIVAAADLLFLFFNYCKWANHKEAFIKSCVWLYNDQPIYKVLPGAPLPSSTGELSVTIKTRPAP